MTKNKNITTSAPVLKLDKFLPYTVSALSNKLSRIIGETYKNKFALSITEWRIMAVLGEHPGSSADEVSSRTETEKSIISRSLQKLLQRNFVAREVDSNDRRRQNLTLTEIGQDVYNQIVPDSYEYEERLLKCFSDQEKATFDSLVERLYKHAIEVEKFQNSR